jgi:hypothetical protein
MGAKPRQKATFAGLASFAGGSVAETLGKDLPREVRRKGPAPIKSTAHRSAGLWHGVVEVRMNSGRHMK